jgi:hypothetical protein
LDLQLVLSLFVGFVVCRFLPSLVVSSLELESDSHLDLTTHLILVENISLRATLRLRKMLHVGLVGHVFDSEPVLFSASFPL